MILNLGCGLRPVKNAVNHDLWRHSDYVDVVWNLEDFPWPWADNSASFIWAHMVFEHLHDMVATMNECWRILEPHGQIDIVVPHWQSPNTVIDFTHVRGFHAETFEGLDPDTVWGKRAAWRQTKPWKHLSAKHGTNIDPDALQFRLEVCK